MLIIALFPFISLSLSIWLAFYKPCLFLTPNDLFAMRHLGKKRLPYVKKTIYFARKTCLLLLSARKTIKFTISHSFIILYLFNWTCSLEDSISIAVAEKKNSILFFFMLLSLFLHLYACHSLSFSLFMLAPEFREKGKINDVAVTFNDLLRIILLPCLFFFSTCCWLFIFVYALVEISDLFLSSVLWLP